MRASSTSVARLALASSCATYPSVSTLAGYGRPPGLRPLTTLTAPARPPRAACASASTFRSATRLLVPAPDARLRLDATATRSRYPLRTTGRLLRHPNRASAPCSTSTLRFWFDPVPHFFVGFWAQNPAPFAALRAALDGSQSTLLGGLRRWRVVGPAPPRGHRLSCNPDRAPLR